MESTPPQTDMMRESVAQYHTIAYRYIMSILVVLGILANGVCVLVLSRPQLRAIKVNRSVTVTHILISEKLCTFEGDNTSW